MVDKLDRLSDKVQKCKAEPDELVKNVPTEVLFVSGRLCSAATQVKGLVKDTKGGVIARSCQLSISTSHM